MMTTDKRLKPDIQYVDTDTEALVSLLVQGYEKITEKQLYPADPIRLFIMWIADILVQQRVQIDQSAKQNIPRFAEGKYLDELVNFINERTVRFQPQAARTKLKYTLTTYRDEPTTIKKGSRVAVDDQIYFFTAEDLIIPAAEVEGTVEALCSEKGNVGNGFLPGQIKKAVDLVPYFSSVTNTTISSGGADLETDDSLYSRSREALAGYSTAGPNAAYRYHALSADTRIADIKTLSPTPGIAEIRVLFKNAEIPSEDDLEKIKNYLSSDDIRPLTDKVEVKTADLVQYDIDLTYYVYRPNRASTVDTEFSIKEAIDKYTKWQSERMGRDINPSMLHKMIVESGVKRVEIRSPQFQLIEDNSVAILNAKTVINGGVEDE